MKKACLYLSILLLILAFLPVCVQAQYLVWHYDRLIEDNASREAQLPKVAISGSKAVAVWYQTDGSANRVYANYSTNGGATWHADRLIEDNAGHMAYYANLAVSGSVVVAAWIQEYGGNNRVYANYSKDGGVTWHADQMIEDTLGGNADWPGPVVSVSGSRALVAWQQSDGSHVRIYVNYSTNGGATWHTRQTIDNPTVYDSTLPSVALSGLKAVVTFSRYDGAKYRIYYNYSTDGGATWHSDQLLEDNAGYDALYPGAHVAMSGNNAVAVWQQYHGSYGSCVYANHSSNGGATWDGDQIIKNVSTSNTASYPQVAMSGTRAVAVWQQQETGGTTLIHSNYSTDGGATWKIPKYIETDRGNTASRPFLAMSGSNAVVAWVEPYSGVNRMYSNYTPNGGATWRGERRIDGFVGTAMSVPGVAISGNKAVAVWTAYNGSVNRVVANYATGSATQKYYLLPPKLVAPGDGSISLVLDVTMSWSDTNSDPQELRYRVRIKPAGGAYTNINVPANTIFYTKYGLANNKTYLWNVRAVGNGTNILNSDWANSGRDWKFTTKK